MTETSTQRNARRLEGMVAIVTGAGSVGGGMGTGKATSILFAREGARIVLVDHAPDRAKETLTAIEDEGGEATVVEADITRAEDCRAAVDAALDRYGRLDILDNNVGIVVKESVVDVTEEDWDRIMAVNAKSMMLMSKYAVPAMAGAGGGSIINISTINVRAPNASTPYAASKSAVEALTRGMAVDHGPQGVRVNCIAPGPLYTPRAAQGRLDEDLRERRRLASPLEREGTAWDIAWAAVFLASEEARYITGVVLPVDGGVSVRGRDYR